MSTMEPPPPSYAEVMGNRRANGSNIIATDKVAPITRSRPTIIINDFTSSFDDGWRPAGEASSSDREDSYPNEALRLQRVINTIIMFVLIFLIIIIIAKLTQHANYVRIPNPHG